MKLRTFQLRLNFPAAACFAVTVLLSLSGFVAFAQDAPASPDAQGGTLQKIAPAPGRASAAAREDEASGGITEEELKRMLVGKPMFLRGGYLSDSLSFGMHGELNGSSAPAPFTLCAVQFDKVSLNKRTVTLIGARFGLHFLGALAYEDPTKAVDRVKITPKKKSLKITIDREVVVKAKKVKSHMHGGKKGEEDTPAVDAANGNSADVAKPETAANAPAGQGADANPPNTTTSPAHSAAVLREALDHIFANSIDERMIAAMPDFWKLYYQAAAAKTDYGPADAGVLRQNMVDRKAKLISKFEPTSNEFAQDHGVAGMALYHVVVGSDGTPGEIAVARPIGFGLDENAVAAIHAARFEPAIKDGKPVPVLLDLVVQFRIFSKRTAVTHTTELNDKPPAPTLPGPYSVPHQ